MARDVALHCVRTMLGYKKCQSPCFRTPADPEPGPLLEYETTSLYTQHAHIVKKYMNPSHPPIRTTDFLSIILYAALQLYQPTVLTMQITLAFIFLLAGIAAAEVSFFSFVTIISHNYGLTAQYNGDRKLVTFSKSNDGNQFFMENVGEPARGWHIVEPSDGRFNRTTNHVRFPDAKDGEPATFDTEWASTFHVEARDNGLFSLILLDPSNPSAKLAWTVIRYTSSDPTMVLKIRPYRENLTSQQFSIVARPRED
ncbi:hypothetical protein FQN49_002921 [Arthroderma sp. PD_2]|nr:hypothetical protein FQN49_002921 [Arthroderma sp. PD_2]